MDSYERAVNYYGQNKVNAEFNNKGPIHASIVTSRIFEYADDSVRIFTGSLNSEVADSQMYLRALKRFVNSNKHLYVIVEELPSEDSRSKALKFVCESSTNPLLNVKIKVANETFLNSVRNSFVSRNLYHFMIADENTYRVETEKDNYKAVCNFNDKKITSRLKYTFDNFFFENNE